jgi:hypothetical protein
MKTPWPFGPTEQQTHDILALSPYMQALNADPATDYLVTYNYAAVFDFVRHLNGVTDVHVLRRMAADPNTAPEALMFLAGICPAEFCANDVLPLLLLENPSLPSAFEPASLGRLLSYAGVPRDLLEAFAAHARPDLAQAAVLHIGMAGAADADWPSALEQAVSALPDLPDDDLLIALLLLGLVPAWLHPRLACSDDLRITTALAFVTGAGERDALNAALAEFRVAPAPPPAAYSRETLLQMADDDDPRIRAAAAAHPDTPPEVLAQINDAEDWGDNDLAVYEALARNPHTPSTTLLKLAAHRIALFTGVRRGAVQNPNTPPEALSLLVDEGYAADIRLMLAAHPNLRADQRDQMRAHAVEQLPDLADPFYRAIGVSYATVPEATLAAAARSPYWLERLAVALNANTPSAVLANLAEDGNRSVRAAVGRRAMGSGG